MVGLTRRLGEADAQRVRDAVAAAEQRSAARLILVVVPASDHYATYPALWAALIALGGGGLLAMLHPAIGLPLGFLAEAALFIALAAVFHLWPLRLALVPRHVKHLAAERLAHREFAVHIVGHTPERNGILLFLSLGERYVEILADRDIHARVPEGSWDSIVAALVARIREGALADGLVGAIESCAALLEDHYPRRESDPA